MTDVNSNNHEALRSFAGKTSVVVGLCLLLVKFYAHAKTGSTLIFSDALESIVNVVAAAFALYSIRFAEAPPDREHPYGHGKIEFVSAAFEGGLITTAAILIGLEALESIYSGPNLHDLDFGTYLILGAGIVNGALGFFLVKIGNRVESMALVADGKHVITDFYTSIALVAGLVLVQFSGIYWLDPAIAVIMAAFLAYTGIKVIRQALSGILDAEDRELLENLRKALEKFREPGVIRLHHIRAMRVGRRVHVDGHIVVPDFWPVDKAHDFVEAFEKKVVAEVIPGGEIEFHIDPCRIAYCMKCDLDNCSIRRAKFEGRPPMEFSEMVDPNPRFDEADYE